MSQSSLKGNRARWSFELVMHKYVLLYLSYGTGPHVSEVIFSVMSAIHHRRDTDSFTIIIYTDDPTPFSGLDVQFDIITQEQMREWAGPTNFGHRRKICALAETLKRHGIPVVLLDGDTYFKCSPQRLFDRVGHRQTLMHLREGEVGYLVANWDLRPRLSGLTFNLHERYEIIAETVSFNSGVIGIDPSDASLLGKVLELNDALHDTCPSWLSEQLAFTLVLNRHTQVNTCRDVVFHYHEGYLREPFRENIQALLRAVTHLPLQEKVNMLYRHRPRPPLSKTINASLKRSLKRFGLFRSDLQTSV